MTLPKFNVDGIEGVYVYNADDAEDNDEQGGQKGDFTEILQKQPEKSADPKFRSINQGSQRSP